MKYYGKFLIEMKLHLQYHFTLNPKLWDEGQLKPAVRSKLLDFAHAWMEFANIPASAVSDIIMTGGNANFNYTDASDIDVHLIVNKDKIAKNNPLLDDYLQDKKVMWTTSHNITILGYPLEPYAQDEGAEYPKNQGVFSLKNNEWVAKPEYIGDEMLKDPHLKQKVKFYMKLIDDMINSHASDEAFSNLKEKLKTMRGNAIKRGGEFSFENLVFKELRNRGYLDKMSNYKRTQQDQELSLK